ncbi:MAG: YhcH/YjgK/YiaL family protein [Lachnospiraceae bacterium]|nr:YhcH/YjgK/YiaL family protein [Lachnospiraceae bacterium]
MIIDKYSLVSNYREMLPHLDNAVKVLESLGKDPKVGRYEFEGGYFMIQEGDTVDISEGDYEAHRRYIDVQVILKGSELVAWDDIEDLKVSKTYDNIKDFEMLSGDVKHVFKIDEGMFWVAFPSDAHKACKDMGEKTHYKKAVVKLPVE